MMWSVLLSVALAGPVPQFGRAPAPPVYVPAAPPWGAGPWRGMLLVPFPTTGLTVPTLPEPPAFPTLPAPSTEKTEWQEGKTRIEHPGTFVSIDELPSAFQPLQPAPDRLQRPEDR